MVLHLFSGVQARKCPLPTCFLLAQYIYIEFYQATSILFSCDPLYTEDNQKKESLPFTLFCLQLKTVLSDEDIKIEGKF